MVLPPLRNMTRDYDTAKVHSLRKQHMQYVMGAIFLTVSLF